MVKRSVLCGTFFSLLVFCVGAFPQSTPDPTGQNDQDQCARYAMRTTTPRKDVDYKMRVTRPSENVDYKAEVIHPCALPKTRIAGTTTNKPGSERRINSISPSFQLLPPTAGKLKTPSERLKGYALPTQPKKDQ